MLRRPTQSPGSAQTPKPVEVKTRYAPILTSRACTCLCTALIGSALLMLPALLVLHKNYMESLKSAAQHQQHQQEKEEFMKKKGFSYELKIQKSAVLDKIQGQAEKYDSLIKEHATAAKMRNSSLRFDWGNLPPMTALGRLFDQVQSQCLGTETRSTGSTDSTDIGERNDNEDNIPIAREIATGRAAIFKLISSGMGSSLHTWSYALCSATSEGVTMFTDSGPWEWNDSQNCPHLIEERYQRLTAEEKIPSSALWCYFGHHESAERCRANTSTNTSTDANADASNITISSTGNLPETFETMTYGGYSNNCKDWIKKYGTPALHGAAMEFLFQNVTDIVIEDAERQIRETFFQRSPDKEILDDENSKSPVAVSIPPPESLITINIRWGDKWKEMKLVPIEEYIDAAKKLLSPQELKGTKPVHIYIASEDPKAIQMFKQHINTPQEWNIYHSGPKISNDLGEMRDVARSSVGRAGLESLAALLISMQANRYVLTTGSNWSRLINELRTSIVDPRCGNCTAIAEFVDPSRSFT